MTLTPTSGWFENPSTGAFDNQTTRPFTFTHSSGLSAGSSVDGASVYLDHARRNSASLGTQSVEVRFEAYDEDDREHDFSGAPGTTIRIYDARNGKGGRRDMPTPTLFKWTSVRNLTYDVTDDDPNPPFIRDAEPTGSLHDNNWPAGPITLEAKVTDFSGIKEAAISYEVIDSTGTVVASDRNQVTPNADDKVTYDVPHDEWYNESRIEWRVHATDDDNDRPNDSSSRTSAANVLYLPDDDTEGPTVDDREDDAQLTTVQNQEKAQVTFRVKLSDPSGVLDDGTWPKIHYRWNDRFQPDSGDQDGTLNADFDGTWYTVTLTAPESRNGQTCYWRVQAKDQDSDANRPDDAAVSWSSQYWETVPQAPAELSVTPDPPDHDFGTTSEFGTDSWSFTVENTGWQTMNWVADITSGRGWLSLSDQHTTTGAKNRITRALNRGQPHSVTLELHPGGLNPGTHTGTIEVVRSQTNATPVTGQITVTIAGIEVTSPRRNAVWDRGVTQTITWNSANVGGDVKIEYRDYDNTFARQTIVASTPNDGSYDWAIPANFTSDKYSIFVTSTTIPGATDRTAGFFIGNAPPKRPSNSSPKHQASGVSATPTLASTAFIDPNPGGTHQASQWQIRAEPETFLNPLWDSGQDAANLTSRQVPNGVLNSGGPATRSITVQADEFVYTPDTLTVLRGQEITITLENNGDANHNLRIPIFEAGTGVVAPGGQESFTFTAHEVGVFEYYSTVGNDRANGMEGTLEVLESEYWWRVRHQDNNQEWSDWSSGTQFSVVEVAQTGNLISSSAALQLAQDNPRLGFTPQSISFPRGSEDGATRQDEDPILSANAAQAELIHVVLDGELVPRYWLVLMETPDHRPLEVAGFDPVTGELGYELRVGKDYQFPAADPQALAESMRSGGLIPELYDVFNPKLLWLGGVLKNNFWLIPSIDGGLEDGIAIPAFRDAIPAPSPVPMFRDEGGRAVYAMSDLLPYQKRSLWLWRPTEEDLEEGLLPESQDLAVESESVRTSQTSDTAPERTLAPRSDEGESETPPTRASRANTDDLSIKDDVPYYNQGNTSWCALFSLSVIHQWWSPTALGTGRQQSQQIATFLNNKPTSQGTTMNEAKRVMKNWDQVGPGYQDFKTTYWGVGRNPVQTGNPTAKTDSIKGMIHYLDAPVACMVDSEGGGAGNSIDHFVTITGFSDSQRKLFMNNSGAALGGATGAEVTVTYSDWNNKFWNAYWWRTNKIFDAWDEFKRYGLVSGYPGDNGGTTRINFDSTNLQVGGTIDDSQRQQISDLGLQIKTDDAMEGTDAFGETYRTTVTVSMRNSLRPWFETVTLGDFDSTDSTGQAGSFSFYHSSGLNAGDSLGQGEVFIDNFKPSEDQGAPVVPVRVTYDIFDEDDRAHDSSNKISVRDDRTTVNGTMQMPKPALLRRRWTSDRSYHTTDDDPNGPFFQNLRTNPTTPVPINHTGTVSLLVDVTDNTGIASVTIDYETVDPQGNTIATYSESASHQQGDTYAIQIPQTRWIGKDRIRWSAEGVDTDADQPGDSARGQSAGGPVLYIENYRTPDKPTFLSASETGQDEITLTWRDNSSGLAQEDNFEIWDYAYKGGSQGWVIDSKVATVGADVTSYKVQGLSRPGVFSYSVRAVNQVGASPYSTRDTERLKQGVPARPTNLVATTVSTSQIDLSWQDNATNEDRYYIYRYRGQNHFDRRLGPVSANQTTFSDTKNLIRGFEYTYEVKANNTAGLSKPSNKASATPEKKPPKPTALQASVASPTQVDLTWKGWRPPTPDGYYVYRDGTRIATVGAGNNTYTDSGLTTNQQYCYRVSAFNSAGETAQSNQACVTVKVTLPNAPSNLTIKSRSTTRITIGWQDNANNEKGFRIYRDGGAIDLVDANETEYTDTNLTPGTQYCYSVTAFLPPLGESAPTKQVCTTTYEPQDTDEDGIPDRWEEQIVDADPDDDIESIEDVDPEGDYDGDGTTNEEEHAAGTDPAENTDSDADNMPDDWERFYFVDLDAFPENDFDGDGRSNLLEFQMDTSPVEYVLDMKAGWNQFSIGTTPLDNSVETLFGDHPVRLPVWTWDGQTYRRAEEIISEVGYWIYAQEPARIEIRLLSRDAPRSPLRILRR